MKEFKFTSGVCLSIVNRILVEDDIIADCISTILDKTKNKQTILENENDSKEVTLGNYTIIFSWDDVVILNCITHYGTSVVNQLILPIVWEEHEFIGEFIDYIKNRKYENA